MCIVYTQSAFNNYLCILISWEICLLAFGNEGCTQILDAQMNLYYIVNIKSSGCCLLSVALYFVCLSVSECCNESIIDNFLLVSCQN